MLVFLRLRLEQLHWRKLWLRNVLIARELENAPVVVELENLQL